MRRRLQLRRGGRAAISVCLVLAATTLAACSSSKPVAMPSATGTGTITIGIATDEPGVSLKSGRTYSGFDIDVARYVAAKLGVQPQNISFKEITSADRTKVLQDGTVDLVVDQYSITPDRQQQVDFAGPYYVAHQDLLIRRNDTDITSPETLNGRTLCSVNGTTSAAYVIKHYAGKITLTEKPRFSDCVNALVEGSVDAVTTDDLILAGYASQEQFKGILKLVGKGFSDEKYGVGVKKGDAATVTKVNAALKSFIDDGSWQRSLDANVGDSGFDIPSPPTVGS